MLTVGVSPAVRVATAERHLGGLAGAGPAAGLVRMIVAVAHAIGCRRAEAEALMDEALASAGRRELALLAPCAEMVRGYYFDYPEGRLAQAAARIGDGLARIEPIEVEESFMMQAFGRGNRALMLADTGRYRACLDEAQAVLDVLASLGMAAAPGLLILWWRLRSDAGTDDWDAATALEPEARRAIAAGPGTNVVYRLAAQLARGAAARGEGDLAVARVQAARTAAREYGDSYEIPAVLGEASLAASGRGRPSRARSRRGGVRAGLPVRLRLVPGPGGAAVGERPRRPPAGGRAARRGARPRRPGREGGPLKPPRAPPRRRPARQGARGRDRGRALGGADRGRLRPRGAARVRGSAGRAAGGAGRGGRRHRRGDRR